MKQILKWLLSVVIVAGIVGVIYLVVIYQEYALLVFGCIFAAVILIAMVKQQLDKYL